MIRQYKLVLVGDGRVGKSCYVNRLMVNECTAMYYPTLGVSVYPKYVGFYPLIPATAFLAPFLPSNRDAEQNAKVCFNIWDCSGTVPFMGLEEGYYQNCDCAIIMFDLTSAEPLVQIRKWYNKIRAVRGNIPIVIVGNKYDLVEGYDITKGYVNNRFIERFFNQLPVNCSFVQISVKDNLDVLSPLMILANQLYHHNKDDVPRL